MSLYAFTCVLTHIDCVLTLLGAGFPAAVSRKAMAWFCVSALAYVLVTSIRAIFTPKCTFLLFIRARSAIPACAWTAGPRDHRVVGVEFTG